MTETEVELSKSDKTREEVLSAAARLFRHEGYYATTMRDIAKLSKISSAESGLPPPTFKSSAVKGTAMLTAYSSKPYKQTMH